MSELGRRLKLAREQKGISIQEVGLSLKINPRVIAGIEEGDRELLPAKTFLRGFVKSYAQFLRMDTKEILDLFVVEYDVEPLLPPNINTDPNAIPSEFPPQSATTSMSTSHHRSSLSDQGSLAKENIADDSRFPIGKILLGVGLFIVVVVLAKLVDKYQKERVLPEPVVATSEEVVPDDTIDTDLDGKTQPAQTDGFATPVPFPEDGQSGVLAEPGAATPAPGPSPVVSATPALAATPTPTPSPTPKATPTPTPTPKPSPSPTPSPTPKPSPSPTPTPTPAPSPTPKATPSPTPAAAAALARPLEVMVEVNKGVRVRYDLGDGSTTTLDLNAGDIHTFRSKMPITLDISDGGALNMIVNGRDRGKAGTAGEPIKLRLKE